MSEGEHIDVVDDLSAYVISGAVSAVQGDVDYDSDMRTPAQGIDDVVEAERLGFRAAWLSERWDIKQADVILSGAAARRILRWARRWCVHRPASRG